MATAGHGKKTNTARCQGPAPEPAKTMRRQQVLCTTLPESCGTCMRAACRVSGALRTAARAPRKLAAAVCQQPPFSPGQPSPPARTLLGAAPPPPTNPGAGGAPMLRRQLSIQKEMRLRPPAAALPAAALSSPNSSARAHAALRSGLRTPLRLPALPYTAAPRRGEGASAGAGALAAPADAGPAWRAPPPRRRAAAVGAGGA